MPSYDFAVDLPALITAARSTAEVVQFKKDKDVSDFVPSESAVGHAVVWGALAEFSERWERGFNDLVSDVEEIAGRLGKVAMTYAEFDGKGAEALTAAAASVTGAEFTLGGGRAGAGGGSAGGAAGGPR